jgi:hypothetical protein
MTTRDISTLLFNNVYLFDTTLDTCCVLGFHTYDLEPGTPKNGNRERRFVLDYASWITNGLFSFGFEDVTALSHEMAELFNDPFVDDDTPWWLSIDPIFRTSLCQNNLETGDVVEVLSGNPVFAASIPRRTYHLQNEALFSWVAFESPSSARLGAYSFPDETTLTSLSLHPVLPGCKPVGISERGGLRERDELHNAGAKERRSASQPWLIRESPFLRFSVLILSRSLRNLR